MRNLCLLLTVLSVASAPALAQSALVAPAQAEGAASKKAGTKRVCKRVADVNSLVAKKVCREVAIHENAQSSSSSGRQPAASAQGSNE